MLRWMLVVLMVVWMFPAEATCTRIIQSPVAQVGHAIVAQGDYVGGIFPDLLRQAGAKDSCMFSFAIVPRPRMELMFESGHADLLFPAMRTKSRDEVGVFIPLIYTRPNVISVEGNRAPIKSIQDIKERGLKIGVVRGYDYGETYNNLVDELQKLGRIVIENDVVSLARLLKSGVIDCAMMAPYEFAGAAQNDSRVADLYPRLRYETVPELGWGESGIYLSKKSLSAEDRAVLIDAIDKASRSGIVWKMFSQYYPGEILKAGNRARY